MKQNCIKHSIKWNSIPPYSGFLVVDFQSFRIWYFFCISEPCIFTNFSWAKSHNFFIKQKSKFTEIFNICWKHVPFILCRSSQFDQMFYISVNFDFCIMKKLWDLAHEKLVNILGGHHVGTNIHGCQPYLKIAIYVLKSANGGLLCRPL